MTTLRKVLPFTLLALVAVWTFTGHHSPINPQVAYAQSPDCSFTFQFTGAATQTAVSNLSGNTPCVNWRLTLSTTGSLSATVTFYTSPDASTWTAVPNTVCSSTVQPPCVLQGANPIVGTQGMLYAASYGSYVQVVVTSPSGTGTGTVRGYGAKGASASALPAGGGGGGTFTALSGDATSTATGGATTVIGINGVLLSGLTTGILKVTAGVPSIAVVADLPGSGATTVNGATCTLGSTCNVNGTNTANTVALNGGAGSALGATAADSTTTHALFATAGAPAFRALASGDLPAGTASGTGTLNVLPRWSNTTGGLQNSAVTDNGTDVLISRPTLVNTTTDIGGMLTVLDTRGTSPRGILSLQTSTDANGGRIGLLKARGTAGTPLAVVTGDMLGRANFWGYDGSNYLDSGSIQIVATGTIATTRVPTYMSFLTSTDATPSVMTEWMRLDQAGLMTHTLNGIGSTPQDSILLTNTTAAANAAQQYSPAFEQKGNAWVLQTAPTAPTSGAPTSGGSCTAGTHYWLSTRPARPRWARSQPCRRALPRVGRRCL